MSKKSIRFFNDREVRAVWDDENNTWWFSATDVVRAINNEPDYTKAGNYWRWLKRKLKQEGIQFVSGTHKLKIVAADGKRYNSDALSADDIVLLARHYPNNRAGDFLNWFTESVMDSSHIKKLLKNALTDKINDREMFMKGIDYSYYYEEE